MHLVFLGTRGNTQLRTRRHYRHSAMMISCGRGRVMIDCGEDWRGRLTDLRPAGILITHAHPDHAWGIFEGAPCPVYASAETWQVLGDLPVSKKRTLTPYNSVRLEAITVEPFPVEHSLRCPALGFRITGDKAAIYYVPDVVAITNRHTALADVSVFIGDGATLSRPMVRRREGRLFGHTPIRTQLGWCQKEGVPEAIFTHCGTEIIAMDGHELATKLRTMGNERKVRAKIAYDGMTLTLPRL